MVKRYFGLTARFQLRARSRILHYTSEEWQGSPGTEMGVGVGVGGGGGKGRDSVATATAQFYTIQT